MTAGGLISVVTPVRPGGSPHLEDAWKSLNSQVLPHGWDWRWVLQEDGEAPTQSGFAERDPRIEYHWNGVQQGAAGTRNFALSRVSTEWYRNLDDDDELAPDSLLHSIGVIQREPNVDFVVGATLDLIDGELRSFVEVLDEGPIEPGVLFRWWVERDFLGAVHPTGLFARTSRVKAVGGYPAVAGSEDTGLLMVLSSLCRGWFIKSPVLHYRRYPGQTIRTGWADSLHTQEQRYSFISQCVAAQSAAGLRFNG